MREGRHFCCVLPHGQVFQRSQWNFHRLLHSRILLLLLLLLLYFSNFVV
jgi:hypothetical protein